MSKDKVCPCWQGHIVMIKVGGGDRHLPHTYELQCDYCGRGFGTSEVITNTGPIRIGRHWEKEGQPK